MAIDFVMHGMNNRLFAAIKAQNLSLNSLQKSLFIREFLLFAASTVFFQGSRFVVSLVAARILGPTTFGFWNILNLILSYSSVIHLGVINGMNRDVPLFKGRGNVQKVEEIRRVSLGFMSLSALVGTVGIVVAVYCSPERVDTFERAC